jgi:PAS domain S-box-containing protein
MWAFVAAALALPAVMYRALDEHTGHEALRQARAITLVATAVRSYYATNVVGPAIRNNGSVTLSEDYHKIDGGIPIPATMSIELGKAIRDSSGARDFEFHFVSDMPFLSRVRPELDEFQLAAIRSFRKRADMSTIPASGSETTLDKDGYWRIEKAEGGSSMIRLAMPVVMEATCVACHNRHPDSPAHNWSIGDVRGIQEVAVEFDTEGQLQDSKEAVAYMILFIGIGLLALREHRSRVRSLNWLNAEMDQSRLALQENTSELELSIRELQTKTTVLDMAPFGIMVMDPDGDVVRIRYVNQAFREAMGYEPTEVSGRQQTFLYGEATEDTCAQAIDKALREHQRAEIEMVTYTRGGKPRVMRWLVFPSYARDSSLLNMVVCLTDVTEIRHNEQEREQLLSDLQESTKLESLALAIAGIAHDLNTPIGVAVTANSVVQQASAQILKAAQADPPDVNELRRLAQRIAKSADMSSRNLERAAQLVRSFKETTADATRNEWRRVRLGSLLDSLVLTISPLMRRARCKVVLSCPPELEMYTEPGSLSQAMTNLMVNATLHAFEGIERREVAITVSLIDSERIRIDIADNGRGMTAEAAGKAFTPFFTTRHKSGGSGLGLFSSRRNVEQVLGGRISFESRLGEGTIFHIELPLNAGLPAKDATKTVLDPSAPRRSQ